MEVEEALNGVKGVKKMGLGFDLGSLRLIYLKKDKNSNLTLENLI